MFVTQVSLFCLFFVGLTVSFNVDTFLLLAQRKSRILMSRMDIQYLLIYLQQKRSREDGGGHVVQL